MTYATLEELRKQVQLSEGDESFDAELTDALGAAVESIDDYCNRSFTAVDPETDDPTVRVYTARTRSRLIVHDLVALDTIEARTSRTADYEAVDAGDVDLWPYNAAEEGRPYTEIRRESGTWSTSATAVRVTGWFGWTAVPDAVKKATLLQASRIFQRRSAQFGVAPVPGLEGGGGMRLLAKLDADVELMLNGVWRNPTRTPS